MRRISIDGGALLAVVIAHPEGEREAMLSAPKLAASFKEGRPAFLRRGVLNYFDLRTMLPVETPVERVSSLKAAVRLLERRTA